MFGRKQLAVSMAAAIAVGLLATSAPAAARPSDPLPGYQPTQEKLRAAAMATPRTVDGFQDDYINVSAPLAQAEMAEFRVPASVSIGQSILESNWGRSQSAVNDNNYFGIKCGSSGPGPIAIGCHDYQTTECTPTCHTVIQSFRVYASRSDSFRDHGRLLNTNPVYASAFQFTNDPDQFVREIAPHWATDPDYANKVIALMRDWNLYRFNSGPPAPVGIRAVVTAAGTQEFGIGPDGHVMSTFWSGSFPDNGGWLPWFAIPTGYADGTTARNATVTRAVINGNPQLFTTAPDGHVMSTFWSSSIPINGGWHEWFAIPTGFYDGTTAPNASVTATYINGMPQLFTTAPDGHVMSTFWSSNIPTNGGWHDWFPIPTGFSDGRAAGNAIVSMTMLNGMPQLFTTAPDGHVMSTFWSANIPTNGGWHDWFAIGTGYADGTTGPNASVSITVLNGMTQLFTTARDGHVISTFWSANIPTNGGWHDWFAIPTGYADGTAAPSATVSITVLNGMVQLFTTARDGHVISTFWSASIPTNGGWHDWFAIPTGYYDGTAAADAWVTVTTLNGTAQLFTIAPNGHVISTFWSANIPTNGGWHDWFAIPTGFYDGTARL